MKVMSPIASSYLTFSSAASRLECIYFKGACFFFLLVGLVEFGRVIADAFRLVVVLFGTVWAFWRTYGARPASTGSGSGSSSLEESGSASCSSSGSLWFESEYTVNAGLSALIVPDALARTRDWPLFSYHPSDDQHPPFPLVRLPMRRTTDNNATGDLLA